MAEQSSFDAGQARDAGERLRAAREAAGLSLAEVGTRLHMPVRIVQTLEAGDWQQLGAPVFVRGQLRSYAKLVKVDLEPLLDQVRMTPVQPVELVSRSHTSRFQRIAESVGRRAVYVVMTAALAIPVWLATQSHFGKDPRATASLDAPPPMPTTAATTTPNNAAPIAAALTPLPRAEAPALKLVFNADSWLTATTADGNPLEKGLVKAGEQRSYRAGEIARLVIGNAAAVEVQQTGSTVDVTPYVRGNVARLAVSSDGSLAPVSN